LQQLPSRDLRATLLGPNPRQLFRRPIELKIGFAVVGLKGNPYGRRSVLRHGRGDNRRG
jgi:hypothetical protein